MISQPGEGARPRRRRSGESYEEKCERRQESRENLRGRNNVTTCRHLPRAAGQPPHSPRQREFLRRRNLAGEAGRAPPRQEPEVQTPPGSSPTVLLQDLWSSPTSPPAQPLLRLSIPLGIPAETIPGQSDSVNTKGTQTLPNPRGGVKDSSQQTDCGSAVFNKEMMQLSNYLKEALHRELLLKQKMVILQELFSTLLEASEKSWQGQLNEDKLKCKLRALENQLQACTQSYSKECVKKILIEMEDQKQTYEQKAKEALQKMLEDKLQTEQQLQNSQRSLAATREDLAFWQEHDTALKAELTKVTTAHSELKTSFHTLQSELQRAEAQNEELQRALQSLRSEHAALHLRATALSQDIDLKAQHITAIEDKLQKEQKQKVMLEATVSHLHNLIQNNQQKSQEVAVQRKDQVFTTQTPPLIPAKENQNTLLEHPEEEEKGEESLKAEMQKKTSQLTAKENECWELRLELEALSEEYRSCLSRLRQCRDELNRSHSQRAQRQRGHWIPLVVALTAVAIATFLASYRP
ncbi:TRAF3-interacting JNK-activating modulator isoform X3 [Chiroxiphia lanceolata]|uniref:TRAF3-interacting JNK-activating modulator isoform X3 n=1 Tax=Chiroxiphia lanceolata TaxID=296741 RepID=UPI0013CEC08B|nr:TRAF3-interacting JNK-activating modulator isoform X3 [Chiroxiphia lanceolata]